MTYFERRIKQPLSYITDVFFSISRFLKYDLIEMRSFKMLFDLIIMHKLMKFEFFFFYRE